MLTTITEYIQNYGELGAYAFIFLWTFLEGETIVVVAGYASTPDKGLLSLHWLILSAWMGSFLGDQVYFYIGRRWGNQALNRFPKWRRGVEKATILLNRYDVIFILSFRFIYGVRNVSSFAMGLSPIKWSRFAILNFIAAGVWAASFSMLGYGFSSLLRKLREVLGASTANHLDIWIGIPLLLLLLVVAAWVIRALNKSDDEASDATKVSDETLSKRKSLAKKVTKKLIDLVESSVHHSSAKNAASDSGKSVSKPEKKAPKKAKRSKE